MARGGRRYRLVVYAHMMNRWAPAIFTLGLALLGLAWALYSRHMEEWRWRGMASVGGLAIFMSLLFLLMRRFAYVQLFKDYLRLATPFLRLNISYKRIRRAPPSNMGALFPRGSVSEWQADIIQPLAKMTAIVIELNALPMPRSFLRLFLSPLFFKDARSPHLVILVDDWMRFSAELDSMRSSGMTPPAQRRQDSSILSRLPRK